ncbi:MAG TPA: insulinase family protein, partial [Chitinophagales bacterium]
DQQVYGEFAQNIAKSRADAKLDKDGILWSGLRNYAKYGAKNPFNSVVSNADLLTINVEVLTDKIHQLSGYKHYIFYYGQNDISSAKETLNTLHKTKANLADYPAAKQFAELATDKPTVYFCNYPMKQAQLILLSKGDKYNKTNVPQATIFNEYYGGSMASVVFQEIREKMALAYAASAGYSLPSKKEDANYVFGFVGTQANKLPQAVDKISDLLNNLEKSDQQFEMSKQSITKRLESDWTTGSNVYWSYLRAKKLDLDYDIRKDVYKELPNMTYDNVKQFFDTNVKGKSYVYAVVGSKSDIDFKALQKLGEVKELSLEELFGY